MGILHRQRGRLTSSPAPPVPQRTRAAQGADQGVGRDMWGGAYGAGRTGGAGRVGQGTQAGRTQCDAEVVECDRNAIDDLRGARAAILTACAAHDESPMLRLQA